MDVINIGRSRRFLKERPIRVTLFDRPRLVCDLICLEAGQTEKRRGLDTSDSLYVIVEGSAKLTSGLQIEELQAQDAALIPPGVDHMIENTGTERLTVMALVTPKPSRAGEVRMPVEGQSRGRSFNEERYERSRPEPSSETQAEGEPTPPAAEPRREYGERRPARPYAPRAPRAGERPYTPRPPRTGERPYTPRPPRASDRPGRPYTPRPAQGDERPYRGARPPSPAPRGPRAAGPPREGAAEGPTWYPRPKPQWRPRGAPPAARPGARPPYPRGAGGPQPPRGEQTDERESLPDERPRRTRFTGPPPAGEARPAPRGRGRPPAGGRSGPPRGAPRAGGRPASGEPPRGRSAPRGQAGAGGDERPRGRGAARGAGSPRPAPRGSRPSAPRAQGRSGPRTSGPRPAP